MKSLSQTLQSAMDEKFVTNLHSAMDENFVINTE
jgi:hypothetical protein